MTKIPEFIQGGIHTDQRGSISFINNFLLNEVKRFYVIQPAGTDVVRAWQGHKNEEKWFYVVAGSFKIIAVKINNWEEPEHNPETLEFDIDAENIGVLHIPGGYANGFKAIKPGSKIIVFSDFDLQESAQDDYRFDQNNWFDWSAI
jgi:dTDP-4-dehydrorhamnose 3,5-epimerase-like enzyme